MIPTTVRSSLLLAVATALPAQTHEPVAPADLRIPIHSGTEAHEPGYGTWAAGDTFKASFHDGFALYPCLGAGYPRNLPLHWRNTRVVAGGEPLAVASQPEERRSDWRIEFGHGAWTEIYEVRPQGVEQMFRIAARPATAGDLTVQGEVTTPLWCEPAARKHQALRFKDADGTPILEYGAAFAIDAHGDQCPVDTSWDGTRITLTVDGGWLGKAAFPVLIDPLALPVVLGQQTGNLAINQIGSTDVGNDHTGLIRSTLTAYTRIFSATDHDVFAILSDATFLTNRANVFSDLTTANSDQDVSLAWVGGPSRWLVGFERETTGSCAIRIYFHDRGVSTLNSGVSASLFQAGAPAYYRNPDLGGAWLGSNIGMLVFQSEGASSTTSNNTIVAAYPVNAVTRSFLTGYQVGAVNVGTTYDRENPTINPVIRGDNLQGWVVAWQELNRTGLNDDWDIMGSRIDSNGAKIANGTILSGGGSRHAVTPQVAGESYAGYMLTYGLSADLNSTTASELRAQPFFWNLNSATPTQNAPSRLIASSIPLLQTVRNGSLTMDDFIGAFWVMTYTNTRIIGLNVRTSAQVVRMSAHAVVVESATLFSDGTFSAVSPSVAYAYPDEHFVTAYGTNEDIGTRAHMLYGRVLDYPPAAGEFRYGTACGAAIIDGHRPWAGNLYYRVGLSSALPTTPTILFAGFGQGAIPLDGAGMTGCQFLLDPFQYYFVLSSVTDANGYGWIGIPLPDEPLFTGDLFFQYFYFAPGANPASLVTTQGLRSQVRS